MSARILLALAICACNAHLSAQMGPSPAAQGSSPQRQKTLEVPCDSLSSQGGVIDVSRVRNVNGEKMCTVPASQMAQTMDEVLEGDELGAAAYAGLVPPCDGVLLNKDMCLTRRQNEMIQQYRTLDNFHSGRWKRKALSSVTAKWRNNIVPYELADGVFSTSERELIESAMRQWESGTCITFRPATRSDTDKIVIQSGMGCYSRIGRVGGSQELSLGTGICRTKRVIMHELGHALGLIHEHQRDDRDNYVRILTQNVQNQFLNQFDKISRSIVDVEKTKYDYRSLMHYGKSFFSNDGSSLTIQTVDPTVQDIIGRMTELSFTDYKSINLMYQCAESCPQTVFCVNGGYVGPSCQCVCPDGTTTCTATTGTPTGPVVPGPGPRPGPSPGPVGPGPLVPGPRRPGPIPGPFGPQPPPRQVPINPFNRRIIYGPRIYPFNPFLANLLRNNRLTPSLNEVELVGDMSSVGQSTGGGDSRSQTRPEYRVVDSQVKNGRNIVHLSTSNVTATIQAIMAAQKNGENFLTSQNNRAGQNRAGQNRAGQNRAGQTRVVHKPAGTTDIYTQKSNQADIRYRDQAPLSAHSALAMAIFPQDAGMLAFEGLM